MKTWATQDRTRQAVLGWKCEVCGRTIADGAGYVTASYEDFQKYEDERAEWREKHFNPIAPGSDTGFFKGNALIDYPLRVHWKVLHRDCDPDLDECYGYAIYVERIRTPAQVIGWTAHLLGKRWLDNTDWQDLLHHIAVDLGSDE